MCAAIKLVFPLLLVLPGLIALALFHEEFGRPDESFNGDPILPRLVVELLPTGVLGIVVGAFLAGILSNLDSYINSASTLVVNDLYRPFVPGKPDRHYLRLARGLIVVYLAAGAGAAYVVSAYFGSVFEAFQTFLSFFQGPLLALLLLGMLTRRATQWGGLAGMIAGVATAVVMHSVGWLPEAFGGPIEISFLWVAWWSFVASIVSTTLVSLATRPYDEERLRGLVCWIPLEEKQS